MRSISDSLQKFSALTALPSYSVRLPLDRDGLEARELRADRMVHKCRGAAVVGKVLGKMDVQQMVLK